MIMEVNTMNTHRIQKWGNSLALRIPKPLALQTGLENNTLVTITIVDGNILICPQSKASIELSKIVEKIDEKNIHSEVEFGQSQGCELW